MLKLLRENRVPKIWVPSPENRDLRQLLDLWLRFLSVRGAHSCRVERLDGARFVALYREDFVQRSGGKQTTHGRAQPRQFHLAAELSDGHMAAYQLADSGTVDEVDIVHVQNNFWLPAAVSPAIASRSRV